MLFDGATLQKLLEEEERSGRQLQQQLREQQGEGAMMAQPSSDGTSGAADLQARPQCLHT